ncbi:universal stress protein [Burkholderia cenocepacia]|uniref:Universal stress protein UspA n=1 Tax=Burkholderia cenocepacia TaxID=95486 RepID=A0A1V2VTB4_9BURK|nr:universal stress protein [Burkholderia cenocepacia]MBR8285426.1 universal stress protein [Burkholderia cenocepacia]MBR8497051.1 universal stress protein [Burkholderia cenocepacia]MDR8100437.1 universal stress protein [Burkholderia cenocepacia]ONJ03934.1 universal stress protein UspA [Burkholderia cenocepacia]ONJ21251.1 universal stress protein UspA [Burkholderia cenocepacia]
MGTTTSLVQAAPAPLRVLIAVDGSSASAHAIAYAKALLPSNAAVHIISVAENPRTLVPLGSKTMAFLESARVELLRDASDAVSSAKAAMDRDDLIIDTEVIDLATRGGDVVNALADSAQTWQAELLIVGARQHHGLLGWVEGTVSGPLGKFIGCPLLIVPEGFASVAEHLPRRMLFAVDGSAIALDALRAGLTFSRAETEFRAIYVVDRPPMLGDFVLGGALEEALIGEGNHVLQGATAILEGTAKPAQSQLIHADRTGADVSHLIARDAIEWNADMIVMGTHGRRGVTGWLVGSVAGRVARITKTPLLLVNPSRA